ncbi:hypothetical protein AVEN_264380-1 [Araneus ventricosus]|uniref:Uncharacterized protein n=1 Tax=Araneus ventricosus TaxID=182803 RepID=A0A4Y2H7W9_ARAVE|nr:hypothetical protein AVEN_264380-1 [Araneus ventricosus]
MDESVDTHQTQITHHNCDNCQLKWENERNPAELKVALEYFKSRPGIFHSDALRPATDFPQYNDMMAQHQKTAQEYEAAMGERLSIPSCHDPNCYYNICKAKKKLHLMPKRVTIAMIILSFLQLGVLLQMKNAMAFVLITAASINCFGLPIPLPMASTSYTDEKKNPNTKKDLC